MESTSRPGPLRRFLFFVVFLLSGLLLAPSAMADLPSSVASRVKKVNTCLEAAETALDAGRLQTAQRKLKDAQRPLGEIEKRYAGKFDEKDPVYQAMLERLKATTAKVKAAEKEATDSETAGAAAEAGHEAQCQDWIDKLGPFVDRKSDQYLRIGADLNRVSEEDQAKCREAYARAKGLFAEYQKVEFARQKTRNLLNIESSLKSAMKYYGRDEAKAAQQAACEEWVNRLAPYFASGRISDRKLIAAATVNPEQIARQQELYEQAQALRALYEQAEFPGGKSHELQTLEAEMIRTLEEFPRAMAQSQEMMSGDLGTRLDQVLRHLDQDASWKQDPAAKPLVIREGSLEPLRRAVAEYAGTVEPGDTKLALLQGKLKSIEDRNAQNRKIGAERTFQRADGYTGPELKSLKEKARAVALEAHAGAEILLVTLPSEEWAIEDVIEFTDTSKTAIRRRITRSVRAEISLRKADGEVLLQEVYLGEDQLPGGKWSALKGHTTWADSMVAENLGKTISGESIGRP